MLSHADVMQASFSLGHAVRQNARTTPKSHSLTQTLLIINSRTAQLSAALSCGSSVALLAHMHYSAAWFCEGLKRTSA
jgi:hypothetical protein